MRAMLAVLAAGMVVGSGGPPAPAEDIVSNANQNAAGTLAKGVLTLRLEIRRGLWSPERKEDGGISVLAFGEPGGPLSIPGPQIRVVSGTLVDVTVTNTLTDSTLYVRGLQTHPSADRVVALAPGESRRLRFPAGAPGTYYYWASFANDSSDLRNDDDSQLSGAFIVEPPGVTAHDRVFVIGNWFNPRINRDIMTINGLSWPYTEHFAFTVGDSVHWRWINASTNSHPMHLHGFYYRVRNEGSYLTDRPYPGDSGPFVVTHLLLSTHTMRLAFQPTRPGNWIFHCHFAFHTSPFLAMDTLAALHGHRMSGLVLGMTVGPRGTAAEGVPPPNPRSFRLLVQEKPGVYDKMPGQGYVLWSGGAVAADSVVIPGPQLTLTRGEPVAMTVVNHLAMPTAVHWHGIELESYSDGVPNWSGSAKTMFAPIAPGDSFTARFTPPRAGTFIYHTHFAEVDQMRSGLYGPLIVLPPGARFDPERDKVVLVSAKGPDDTSLCCGAPPLVNGEAEPGPQQLAQGVTYRLRLINIHPDWRVRFRLTDEQGAVPWTPVAKDGADLPMAQRRPTTRALITGPGETADYTVRFTRPGTFRLEMSSETAGWFVPLYLTVSAPGSTRRLP